MNQVLCRIKESTAESAIHREWLLTNGIGGYAQGTELGVNTRRYHGLLIGSLRPPVGRVVGLHTVLAWLELGEERFDLSTQQFGDNFHRHPEGWKLLSSFTRREGESVSWTWRIQGTEVVKTLYLKRGLNKAKIEYVIRSGDIGKKPAILWLRPLTPLRDFHQLDREKKNAYQVEGLGGGGLRVQRNGLALELQVFGGGKWRVEPQWWRDFAYAEEKARGQDWREDVFSPGVCRVELDSEEEEQTFTLQAEMFSPKSPPPDTGQPAITNCTIFNAADQFVVMRQTPTRQLATIVAGWPWFADWGRDAMISLPGLLLCSERFTEAREVLELFGNQTRDGLIPNRFDDYAGEPHYNTVDASLWFIHAVWEYARSNPDDDIADLVDVCRTIVRAYREGTHYGIRVDRDGLVAAGDATTQLTWMDAQRNGVIFTPRHGKPVEINALWRHALCSLAEMVGPGDAADKYHKEAKKCAASFQKQFWWAEKGCCHDVLTPEPSGSNTEETGVLIPDGKIRPNQIFAASLPHSPLTKTQQKGVVKMVRERLLTPWGLHTLDPADPDYQGQYAGNMMQRDRAYHNGAVWPWLIGPYGEAVLRVNDFSEPAQAEVRQLLQSLWWELQQRGQLPEVYDGDEPHHSPQSSGCMAQAWSVAEVLRLGKMVGMQCQ